MGDAGLNTFSGNTLRNLKEIEEDLNSIQKFSQLWSVLGASRYPIILLIDDISYLNPTEASLFSLFASIPPNVKVVLSFSASSTAYLPFVQNGYAHFQLNGFHRRMPSRSQSSICLLTPRLCPHNRKIFLLRGCWLNNRAV